MKKMKIVYLFKDPYDEIVGAYVDEDGQMAVWSSPALKDYEQ